MRVKALPCRVLFRTKIYLIYCYVRFYKSSATVTYLPHRNLAVKEVLMAPRSEKLGPELNVQ